MSRHLFATAALGATLTLAATVAVCYGIWRMFEKFDVDFDFYVDVED